jgi:phosphoserine phosphatase
VKFTNEDPMPLSGEAIRLMNYIDDVAVTLRRILAAAPTLTPEEAARVGEHLSQASPSAEDVARALAANGATAQVASIAGAGSTPAAL